MTQHLTNEGHALRHIWVSVLVQAARDLLSHPPSQAGVARPSGPGQLEKYKAQQWIGSRDFREVCGLAGVDPDRAERAFRKRLAERAEGKQIFHRTGAASHKVKIQ